MDKRLKVWQIGIVVVLGVVLVVGSFGFTHAEDTTLTETTTILVTNGVVMRTTTYLEGGYTVERYTNKGRMLSFQVFEDGKELYSVTYTYENNNPFDLSNNLILAEDSDGSKKENLQFDTEGRVTLMKFHIEPPKGMSLINDPQEAFDVYVGYTYHEENAYGIPVRIYMGIDPQDVQDKIDTEDYFETVILGDEKNILFTEDFTQSITRTYESFTLPDGSPGERLIEYASLRYGTFFETIEFSYDGHFLKEVKITVDAENDGVIDEQYQIIMFYNDNGLLQYYITVDENGAATYTYEWDRDDQYAALVDILDESGQSVEGAERMWLSPYPGHITNTFFTVSELF